MQAIIYSAVAGICGTGLGGLISTVIFVRPSAKATCYVLMFAAGVMVSIVCFGLIPEAIGLTGVAVSVIGLIIGVVIIMLLNRAVDRIAGPRERNRDVHMTHEELYHESQIINMLNDRASMLRSGILMLIAIGLHNIPEGMAIGAGGSHDARFGLVLAIMIALHNIPEGMAIATPLAGGGIKKWKVIALTALSGAPTLAGGVAGVLLGGISELAIALSLSAAGGAMLYVVFGEIIPQSIVMTRTRLTSIIALFGVLVGLIITQI